MNCLECKKEVYCKGLCKNHYQQICRKKEANGESTERVLLTEEQKAINRKKVYRKSNANWRQNNPQATNEYSRLWKQRNPENGMYHSIVRRANGPRTLSGDEQALKEKVRKIKQAGLSVDHIIPLNGEFVSGLHVSWNLQGLTMPENASKGRSI